jgi:predicted unusual protein kinase regulating ubiquinone biosynthesis (AarF/ABC1/UbiB family)
MDWMEGVHLSQFKIQIVADKIGQALWDFICTNSYPRKVHADPHPGNFF